MKAMMAVTFAGALVLGGLAGCSKEREVPQLEGLELKSAQSRIVEREFKVGDIQKEFTGQKESGTVLRQVPTASTRAAKGTTIHLTVEESVTVPDVTRLDVESATRTLTNQGLRVQRVDKKFVGGDTLGAVVSQIPTPGARARTGAAVDLVVDDFIVVRDYTGESNVAVRKTLQQEGLVPGKNTSTKTPDHPVGTILSQDPEVGTKVPRGSAIQFDLASVATSTNTGILIASGPGPSPETNAVSSSGKAGTSVDDAARAAKTAVDVGKVVRDFFKKSKP